MLTCGCGFDYEWYYDAPSDFSNLETTKRKRCLSCGCLIDIGAVCLKFRRWRQPNTDIEERIHGDEVELADGYTCDKCGEIFLNLYVLGYCLEFGMYTMQEHLEQYWELTGFEPRKEE